jgi:hypothetical protein
MLELFENKGEKFASPFPKSHPLIIGMAEELCAEVGDGVKG